jgi:hypothetical protein
MQPESGQHKNFGQPVVSKSEPLGDAGDLPLSPAQAAKRFCVPEYLLRTACAEGRLQHLRVVNTLWLAPADVAAFALAWRTKKRGDS